MLFKNILHSIPLDAFRAYFESFGQINDIVLMMDKDTRMNKGYGFVKFEDPRCSEDVLGKKGQHQLDGKMVNSSSFIATSYHQGGWI